VPTNIRFQILKDIVTVLSQEQQEMCRWRNLVDKLAKKYEGSNSDISKNSINAVMLAARQAQVIRTLKGKTLAMAPVLLAIEDEKPFQEAVMRCDAAYLQGILDSEEPFDLEEAAVALYDSAGYSRYLQVVMKKWIKQD
jgi:phytoene dehydrogenase-like protein